MSNIFEIIPNLFISTLLPVDINGNIISINNPLESIDNNKVLNINFDTNQLLIKSNNNIVPNLDFDLINNFIINSYRDGIPVIILCDNLIVSTIICIDFLIKYLELNLLEAVYFICKKININYKMLPSNILYNLFMNKKN